MPNPIPIKRAKSLVLLSRDHHTGLLVVWKIRQGLQLDIATDRIVDFIIHAFEQEEEPHFCEEESLLFAALPANDEWRLKAESDHAATRKIVAELKATNNAAATDIQAFANTLEAHIRFEERIFFPYFEKTVSPAILEETGRKLEEDYRTKTPFVWQDEFWINPKQNR